MDFGSKCLVDFIVGKAHFASFDRSNDPGAIDVKMNGTILNEN